MEAVAQPGRRPRLGLALSGGGGRGLAHIGVLKALEGHGIRLDCLAGTSMGGIMAAGYAAGRNAAELEDVSAELGKFGKLIGLTDLGIHRGGLFKGSSAQSFLAELLQPHHTFETLTVPLTLSAVDLRSGREVALREGDLLSAVNATMAVPGLFEPVEWDGMQLVDGGVLNNLPVDMAREMEPRALIAVDVSLDPSDDQAWKETNLPQIGVHIWRTLSIMIAQQTELKVAHAKPEILIRPAIPKGITTISGFRHRRDVIDAGEQAMDEALPRLEQLLDRIDADC